MISGIRKLESLGYRAALSYV